METEAFLDSKIKRKYETHAQGSLVCWILTSDSETCVKKVSQRFGESSGYKKSYIVLNLCMKVPNVTA